MDRSHRLDAPDNEALKNIEQVSDHSELSTIYPHAHNQWSGELVTETERDRRHQKTQDTISFGIRKEFAIIGVLIPLPVVFLALLVSAAFLMITEENAALFVIPGIFIFLILAVSIFFIYKKVFKIFYTNALQAGPFIIALLAMLTASASIIYTLTTPIHTENGLISTVVVSLFVLIWSIILCFGLLRIWTTPKLKGNTKAGIIGIMTLGLIGWAVYALFPYFA